MSKKNQIFISCADDDIETASRIYMDLKNAGFSPWMVEEDILPGQNVKLATLKAIEESDYFFALISSKSLTRRGYFQRELRDALEILYQSSFGEAFIIPVLIDPKATIPDDRMKDLMSIKLYKSYSSGIKKIFKLLSSGGKSSGSIKSSPRVRGFKEEKSGYDYTRKYAFDPDLQKKIVSFLESLPRLSEVRGRKALLYSAFLDEPLMHMIEEDGPTNTFTVNLVNVLIKFGRMKNGFSALEAVLESAKNYVGPEGKRMADDLIRQARLYDYFEEKDESESGEEVPGKTEKINWLHLTDLHVGMKDQQWYLPGLREIFFEDLKSIHDKCGPWDLVLFTGDLTQTGSKEEFKRVDDFMEDLWEEFLQLGSDPKLLAVPGNHDVKRLNESNPVALLLKAWNDSKETQDAFWSDETGQFRETVREAFGNYISWWKNQPFKPDNIIEGILPGDFAVTFKKGVASLGVLGLNTAYLQLLKGNYQGKLALHARQFHGMLDGNGFKWAKKHHTCLLMTHHPPASLNSESQSHYYGEINSMGRFAMHLYGHMHEVAYRDISEGGADSRRMWQGKSLFSMEKYGDDKSRVHGYSAGSIELDENQGILSIWPREARIQGNERWLVPDYDIRLLDDGHTKPKYFDLLREYVHVDL